MVIVTLLVIAGIAVALYVIAVRRQAHAAAMWSLRYPVLEDDFDGTISVRRFADLKAMLYVTDLSGIDINTARVYHLRRRDGPVWETSEEYESLAREKARIEAERAKYPAAESYYAKRIAELNDNWEAIGLRAGALETAYQQFLRQYRDVKFTGSPLAGAVSRDIGATKAAQAKAKG
jgi:hypothetical protein